MTHKYSTALSHAILAGTSIYCCSAYSHISIKDILEGTVGFPSVSYIILAVNSVIGVWRWGNPDHGDDVAEIFKVTTFLETIFVLPCIATQMVLDYGYEPLIGYAHAAVSFCALITYIAEKYTDELVELIIIGNSISLAIVSILHENYYGLAAAVSFFLNYTLVKQQGANYEDIPTQDIYNYGLCFFALFALKALGVSTVE